VCSQHPVGGGGGEVPLPEDLVRQEVENVVALVLAHEDVEGLVRKVTLLEGGLAKACRV
jgi:hypothetical protein